ncbi:hypothetical protein [Desulfosporosinus sp. I2]|uniref:hypothetical protein n=1 Tax=Desulfosporosinus sp. I2 TaxID=1617025 RepID=UPI0012E032AF|nr:hypothetical protein [Desulfosporosinus sp. I2]
MESIAECARPLTNTIAMRMSIAEPPTTKEDLVAKDEPFATLRLVTHTPAVWILNFRVRYTKSGRAFRHTATRDAHSCSVDPERVEPRCLI